MTPFDAKRRAAADELRQRLAQENVLSPNQARLFVRCLQNAWEVPPIAWTAVESRAQFDDARRLLHAAAIFNEVDVEDSQDAIACYKRAAELLEWLSRSSDVITNDVPLGLLAAGAYQLAGLPAMATSLLRKYDSAGRQTPLYAAFLSADFDKVISLSASFWAEHEDLTGREGSAAILQAAQDDHNAGIEPNDGIDADNEPVQSRSIGWYVVVELVRAMGLLADGLRRGNEDRTQLAVEKLAGIAKFSTRLASDEIWMLITLFHATSVRFARNSLHVRTAGLVAQLPALESHISRFARQQFARGRGILWASQIQGLDKLAHHSSFALCTPTGSGKTLVANLALVKELLQGTQDKIAPLALYLVPSRALAGEVETKLTAELGDELVVTGLYGGTDWGITDYWLTANRPTVLIATVEKAEALVRYMGKLLISRLRLLIIDEAHQVVSENNAYAMATLADHSSRPMRLEAFVSRLFTLKPNISRIALTAVAGGAAEPIARWVEGNAAALPVGLGYRSSRQLIGSLHCLPNHSGRVALDFMNGQALHVRGRDTPAYLALRIQPMPKPAAVIRNSLVHYNQLHVLWNALHILEGHRRVLISVAQAPERFMKRYSEAFALPGWENVGAFVPPSDPVLLSSLEEARAACLDYCGPQSYELALLNRGIATSHGQMPQRLRRLMINLIEKRVCPITLATATLTEGVNLPFDLIFITSIERSVFDPNQEANRKNTLNPMSIGEFRNLSGRAGRPGASESIEGITMVALPTGVSTTAPVEKNKQLIQINRLNATYESLIVNLAADGSRAESVTSPLALLMTSIMQKAVAMFGLTEEQLYSWLEVSLPENIGANLGVASQLPADVLGDNLDELDGFILSAIQELSLISEQPIDGGTAEAYLRNIWARTFTYVAATQEAWMERSFLKRGHAFVESLYRNPEERDRLYQFGFTPHIGKVFARLAPQLLLKLAAANNYGALQPEQRFELIYRLALRVNETPAVGFRAATSVRSQAVLSNWANVLGWWMQRPGASSPPPEELRNWQRFVTDNLEFRFGVAIGAAVAQAWSTGAKDLETPTLETWRAVSGLPWIAFWIRELLRWGTLDPFVAFALAQGLAGTRAQAAERRPDFERWLIANIENVDSESFIDPQNFGAWQRSLLAETPKGFGENNDVAELTGANGQRGIYDVRPIVGPAGIDWIDSAGFKIARSALNPSLVTASSERHDFQITTLPQVRVARTF